jgi:hypothetical protein
VFLGAPERRAGISWGIEIAVHHVSVNHDHAAVPEMPVLGFEYPLALRPHQLIQFPHEPIALDFDGNRIEYIGHPNRSLRHKLKQIRRSISNECIGIQIDRSAVRADVLRMRVRARVRMKASALAIARALAEPIARLTTAQSKKNCFIW